MARTAGESGSTTQGTSLTRKLIHLAMALLPAVGWWISYGLAMLLTSALVAASVMVEAARRWWPQLNRLLWRLLPTIFRESEGRRLLGSTWFVVGALASFALFGRDIGGTAVLFLCWGDPAAELIGVRWGRADQRKTVIGSLGCLSACAIAGLVGMSLGGLSVWVVLIGGLVATLVERWSPPPNDNLWMPAFSGLGMAMAQWLIGGDFVLLPLWR